LSGGVVVGGGEGAGVLNMLPGVALWVSSLGEGLTLALAPGAGWTALARADLSGPGLEHAASAEMAINIAT